jgi:hypothetical protein
MPKPGLRLKVLPFRVILATINRENLANCTHALMKLLLFQERYLLFREEQTGVGGGYGRKY